MIVIEALQGRLGVFGQVQPETDGVDRLAEGGPMAGMIFSGGTSFNAA